MSERFTTAAREVVRAAQRHAAGLSHEYVGTEHLLLGLLDDAQSAVAKVLTSAGLDPSHVRREILRLVGGGAPCGTLGEIDAAALQAIGIDLESVRSKLESSFGEGVLDQPNGGAPGHRLPITPRAKKSLQLAMHEARSLRHKRIDPEHVLLGLLQEGRGVAAQIIAARAPLDDVRQRLLAELDAAA